MSYKKSDIYKLPYPNRETLGFITIPCLKFWAQK